MPEPAGKQTILVVDDDRLVQMMLTDLLREGGFTCITANNGLEALEACEGTRPNLILLDITMPVMDGIETCRQLKGNPATASIPVLALTTHDDPPTVFAMMEAGALLYLTKPVSSDRLLSAINLALSISAG
jgi:CheY-like chemotaxis protein